MKRNDPRTALDLTDEEVAVLRSSNVPAEVKAFVTRQHDTIGARIMAYEVTIPCLSRGQSRRGGEFCRR